ncbi:hypothetical protein [Comamonas terrae]|uniref:Uncharacterized protein n=1 Tax=Comamonas terrae TaxID=673548 RepID=A0ABW5URN7_9BURK|nr:hypothetical protein [Comamonas terrae]
MFFAFFLARARKKVASRGETRPRKAYALQYQKKELKAKDCKGVKVFLAIEYRFADSGTTQPMGAAHP